MKEKEWEKLLRIKTTGRDDTRSDTFRYPYEPTSVGHFLRTVHTCYPFLFSAPAFALV